MVYLVSMNRFLYLSIHLYRYIYNISIYIIYLYLCISNHIYITSIFYIWIILNTFAHFLCQIRFCRRATEPLLSHLTQLFEGLWEVLLEASATSAMSLRKNGRPLRGWRHGKTLLRQFIWMEFLMWTYNMPEWNLSTIVGYSWLQHCSSNWPWHDQTCACCASIQIMYRSSWRLPCKSSSQQPASQRFMDMADQTWQCEMTQMTEKITSWILHLQKHAWFK
jgi:hypothetical protein